MDFIEIKTYDGFLEIIDAPDSFRRGPYYFMSLWRNGTAFYSQSKGLTLTAAKPENTFVFLSSELLRKFTNN